MQINEFKLKYKNTYNLQCKLWYSEAKPKAIIILTHGFGEHISRYNNWAKRFINTNYFILGYDLLGHGNSEGKRCDIEDYSEFTNSLQLIENKANELYPNIPKILYGHSMGGGIVLNYLLTNNTIASKVIITSPWLIAYGTNNFLFKFVKLLARVIPKIKIPTNLNCSEISNIKEEIDKYKSDKLIQNCVSIRMLVNVVKKGVFALKNSQNIYVPILLLHGNKDKITMHTCSKEISLKNQKIKYNEYEGVKHELHNDFVQDKVFEDIINWINY